MYSELFRYAQIRFLVLVFSLSLVMAWESYASASTDVDGGVSPTADLMAGLRDAVGGAGSIERVMASRGHVQVYGLAEDPAAVLAAVQAAKVMSDARVDLDRAESDSGLRSFVLAGFMGPGASPTEWRPFANSANPLDDLIGRVREVLDAHMSARCELVSSRGDLVGTDHGGANVGASLRLRCLGSLEQLTTALRELEQGAPSVRLADFALYNSGPDSDSATGNRLDIRLSAVGLK